MISRPPAVAGMFYPSDPVNLRSSIEALLSMAPMPSARQPKALIVPHAGYIYSGATAASAYAMVAPWGKVIKRVVLLGPTHRVPVQGIAMPESSSFNTPLGDVPVDLDALSEIAGLPQVLGSELVHAQEHSLEVHLPFLQCILEDFSVVPLAVGNSPPEAVAEVIDKLWGGPETLIVVSTDLSHYQAYAQAKMMDEDTCRRILDFDAHLHTKQACGAYPVNGLLVAALRHRLEPELLSLCNSGDTAGDKERVVGYAAFAFTPPRPPKPRSELGRTLIKLARSAIAGQLGKPSSVVVVNLPELAKSGATFVTLSQNGKLRGCIGSLLAHRSLQEDVQANAIAAAFRDPRFPPLSPEELPYTRIEVSLLTPPEPIHFKDEADALAQLRPGVDGVIFTAGPHRSTFLPQVWEQLPKTRLFMEHLKVKAGLPADYWAEDVQLERYRVDKWKEETC